MSEVDKLFYAMLESDSAFREKLKSILKHFGISVVEFCEISKISKSTIYKILSEKREPNLKTIRTIFKAIKRLEGEKEKFVAVIAARPVLNEIIEKRVKIENKEILIREYPSNSMEEALISAVLAERDGACALVCAPIVSPTIEKILRIPVATIMPKSCLIEAIKLAAHKSEI